MLDILQTYLNDAASPDFTQMIREAHASLDLFGIEHYQDDFVQLLMVDDNVDAGQTVQNIYNTTKNWQYQTLMRLGVTLDPEIKVEHLTRFLLATHALEATDDPTAVLDRATLELHAPELFAELLAVVSAYPPEEWLVDIHDVSQMTIRRVIELAAQRNAIRVGSEEPAVDHRIPYVKAYKAFKETLSAKKFSSELLMDRFFAEGMDVGYPFVVYLNLVGETLGTLDIPALASNMIAMALVSTDGHEKVRDVINTHLENYVNDLDVITRITILVNDLLIQHEHVHSSGVKPNVAT